MMGEVWAGWISPDGRFHPVRLMDAGNPQYVGHYELAIEILELLNLSELTFLSANEVRQALVNEGYCRVDIFMRRGVDYHALTQHQRLALIGIYHRMGGDCGEASHLFDIANNKGK